LIVLHLLQPAARLAGRLSLGLTPWRRRGARHLAPPWPRTFSEWTEQWQAPDAKLRALEAAVRAHGVVALRGGDFDRWDLEVRGGPLGAARLRMVNEEHGGGRQRWRVRVWSRASRVGLALELVLIGLATGAAFDGAWAAAAMLGGAAVIVLARSVEECAMATGAFLASQRALTKPHDAPGARRDNWPNGLEPAA
jgi:hypothetical protein